MQHEAIILAGGFGTRLQSVISEVPKPMAPVGGRPFLAILIDKLIDQGVQHVVLSVGYLHEVIQDYFGDSFHGAKISYVVESSPLGTGGAAALAVSHCRNSYLFLLNGDTYFDVNLQALLDHHREISADISLAIKPIRDQDRYGTVIFNGPWITDFQEKRYVNEGYINGGVYCFRRDFFTSRGLAGRFSLETDVLGKMSNDLKISGLIQDNYFIDIGIPSDYEKAQSDSTLS